MLQLHELCRDLGRIDPPEAADLEVGRVDHDSRQVDNTSLFMALSGRQTNGLEYVEQALARGAVAIGLEKGSARPSAAPAIVWFDEARRDMATLSARVTNHPQEELEIVAVTGTNGKTSVTTLLHRIVQEASVKSGLIGTIATRIGELELPTNMTTPESTQLYRLLERMVQEQVRVLCMEYSSVGIEEHRIDQTNPRIAIYLNLTQDHLDYHKTMANYGEAKTKLFTHHLAYGGVALVCIDDAFGLQLADRIEQQRPDVRCLRVSTTNMNADIIGHLKSSAAGIHGRVIVDDDEVLVSSPLLGSFNCQNLTVAVAAARLLKIPTEKIQAGLRQGVIPGRLEQVPGPNGVHVVIDYAHTPDALKSAIETLKHVAQGKCIVVFGCGEIGSKLCIDGVGSRCRPLGVTATTSVGAAGGHYRSDHSRGPSRCSMPC